MSEANYPASLAFVWQKGYDSPEDGYHVTPGDSGGGTLGGVIEETWAGAVAKGLVSGTLANATKDQLSTVLRDEFWGSACDALPAGLDFLLFNGRMMSGRYPLLLQRAVGAVSDGNVGPATIALATNAARVPLITALTIRHVYYMSTLASWSEFYAGWLGRVLAARDLAKALTA